MFAEDMPEDLPDRMPEDLPVTKRIDVMVGITRSKVIFIFCTCIFYYIFMYNILTKGMYRYNTGCIPECV